MELVVVTNERQHQTTGMVSATPRCSDSGGLTSSSQVIKLKVVERRDAAEGVVMLTLSPQTPVPLPSWSPGARIDLVLGPQTIRQYSLCGDPRETDRYQIAVLLEPEGRGGSQLIHDTLHEGEIVEVSGPRNHFAFHPSPRYLFVAGGIGITPILPMIAEADGRGADWRLVYAGRSRAAMVFVDELARYGDRVEICPKSENGRLDLDTLLAEPKADTLVYCCGPERLLAAVEQRCVVWPDASLHTERFSAPPPTSGGNAQLEDHAFTVHFERSDVTAEVRPGESIIEVAESNAVPVSTSCQVGVCGTCETRVLEGRPEHRDCVLDDAEKASNQVMMICVSRCKGTHLRLDL